MLKNYQSIKSNMEATIFKQILDKLQLVYSLILHIKYCEIRRFYFNLQIEIDLNY
jgi:hypothetical protein